jgi:class 3 adenylate cyclase
VLQDRRIQFRVGIHVGDVVEEADGDLMGDGVNIAARLEGVAKPGAICLSEDAYRQVPSRLAERNYSLHVGLPAPKEPERTRGFCDFKGAAQLLRS